MTNIVTADQHEQIDVFGECEHVDPDEDETFVECDEAATSHASCFGQLVQCADYARFDAAQAAFQDRHTWGAGIGGDSVRLCYDKPMGTYCEDCSHDCGDWVHHRDSCADCGADIEGGQCEQRCQDEEGDL